MTILAWVLAVWGGALVYVMIGALVWRLLPDGEPHDPLWSNKIAEPCGYRCRIMHYTARCPGCTTRAENKKIALAWPFSGMFFFVTTSCYALIYKPFRACIKAISGHKWEQIHE
jgi:hypothetical protein